MPKDGQTLDDRVKKLEQTTAKHEKRIAALEKLLDPKVREQRMTADLQLLLNDLAGAHQDDSSKGKVVK